jgi:hypothetical protein
MLGLLGSNTHPLVSEKTAAASDAPLVPTRGLELNEDWGQHRNKLLKTLALLGLSSAAIGGGITGGFGLHRLHQMRNEKPEALPGNIPLTMPPGRLPPSDEPEKIAASVPFGHWKQLIGMTAQHPSDIPLGWLAAPAVGVGGLLGSSALMNRILHNKMKSVRSNELAQSQQEFDKAMLEQYDSPQLRSEKISSALDYLYDAVEKQAISSITPGAVTSTDKQPLTDASSSGSVLGPLALAAALSGSFGLRAGYRWAEGRKPENLLRDVMKQRALRRAQAMPESIQFAAPRPADEQELDE